MVQVPSWLGTVVPGASDVTISDAPVYVPVPDKPVGWRFHGMHYSAIPDPELYVDPKIVSLVRRHVDPNFVPLVVKWVFQPPVDRTDSEKLLVFKRHGLASLVPYPKTNKVLFHVEMPSDARFPVPNQLDEILMREWNPENFSTIHHKSIAFPGEYVPFTWEIFHNPRVFLTTKQLRERFLTKPKERLERDRARLAEEMVRMDLEAEKWAKKQFDKLSDSEIEAWLRRLRARVPVRYRDRTRRRAYSV